MSEYDFSGLSDYDLELLTRDLLNKDQKLNLQSFKVGRDQGIDLRYSGTSGKDIIVQCKHYLKSGSKLLITHLRKKELPKVKKLNPKRYIIATSCALSAKEKDEIYGIFKPYCLSPDDVFGSADLNNLLRKHPDIERAHFKLWLSSTGVLQSFINSIIINRTREQLLIIAEKAKIYVATDSFLESKSVLEEHNFCIITGVPGVGKTTLGEMLLIDYVSRGFEAVYLSDNIDDGLKIFSKGKRQIFYFDDFFGKTRFITNGRNEDKKLMEFITIIKRDPSKRLILSTRDYILKQAFEMHEDLDREKDIILKANHVIRLSSYSNKQKALILYNHLFHNGVSEDQILDIVKSRKYRDIIGHKNYVPRIIEWVISRSSDYDPHNFAMAFINALNNPNEVWRNAFEKHISSLSRIVLFSIFPYTSELKIDELEASTERLASLATRFHIQRFYGDFLQSIRELDGTFLRVNELDGSLYVFYHNPSIIDFIELVLNSQNEFRNLLLDSLFEVEQIWSYGEKLDLFRRLATNPTSELANFGSRLFRKLTDNFHQSSKTHNLSNMGFRNSPDALAYHYAKFQQNSTWIAAGGMQNYPDLRSSIIGYVEKLFNSGSKFLSDAPVRGIISKNMLDYHGHSAIIDDIINKFKEEIFQSLNNPVKACEFFKTLTSYKDVFSAAEIDKFLEAIESNCGHYFAIGLDSDSLDEVSGILDIHNNLQRYNRATAFENLREELNERYGLIEDGTIQNSDEEYDYDDYEDDDRYHGGFEDWSGIDDMFDGLR